MDNSINKPSRSSNTGCCVVGCTNTYSNTNLNTKFYCFPSRPYLIQRRQKWIESVNRINSDGTPWKPNKGSRICSDHFVGGKKSEDPRKAEYNPTIFPDENKPKGSLNINLDCRDRSSLTDNEENPKNANISETKKRPASPSPVESVKQQKLNDEESDQHVIESITVKIEPEEYVYFAVDDNLVDNKIDKNEQMCRVCLNVMDKSDPMYPLSSVIDVDNRNFSLIDCLNIILRNKVDTDNHFPNKVCSDCIHRIISSYLLIEQWEKNQEKLKEMQNLIDNPVEIKKEVFSQSEMECNYSNGTIYKSDTEQVESLDIKESAVTVTDKNKQIIKVNDKETSKLVYCKDCALSIRRSDLSKHLLNCKKIKLKPHTSKENQKYFVCKFCDTLILPEETKPHSKICTQKQKNIEIDHTEISNEEGDNYPAASNTGNQESADCSVSFISKQLLDKHLEKLDGGLKTPNEI